MSEKTFEIYPEIKSEKVYFNNRFGIKIAGDLYLPADYENQKNPAIAVSGPFGGVKEQCSGLYAQEFARMGFVAVAFDQSFTGESGGEVRDVASPEIFTEDFSAAVDYLGLLPYVDRKKIGLMGICGLTGMALTAATLPGGAFTRNVVLFAVLVYELVGPSLTKRSLIAVGEIRPEGRTSARTLNTESGK